jgi:hypothetical protein
MRTRSLPVWLQTYLVDALPAPLNFSVHLPEGEIEELSHRLGLSGGENSMPCLPFIIWQLASGKRARDVTRRLVFAPHHELLVETFISSTSAFPFANIVKGLKLILTALLMNYLGFWMLLILTAQEGEG